MRSLGSTPYPRISEMNIVLIWPSIQTIKNTTTSYFMSSRIRTKLRLEPQKWAHLYFPTNLLVCSPIENDRTTNRFWTLIWYQVKKWKLWRFHFHWIYYFNNDLNCGFRVLKINYVCIIVSQYSNAATRCHTPFIQNGFKNLRRSCSLSSRTKKYKR